MIEYQYSYYKQKGYKKTGKWSLSPWTLKSREILKTGETHEHGSYRTRINELECIHYAEMKANAYTGEFTILYSRKWETMQSPISPKNSIWQDLPKAIQKAAELNLGELTLNLIRIAHNIGIETNTNKFEL